MAIARLSDCHEWHREYCELYWRLNEYQLAGLSWRDAEYTATTKRMNELVALLGYVPAA